MGMYSSFHMRSASLAGTGGVEPPISTGCVVVWGDGEAVTGPASEKVLEAEACWGWLMCEAIERAGVIVARDAGENSGMDVTTGMV